MKTIPTISDSYYETIECVESVANPGTRYLVRRDFYDQDDKEIIIDYITVRTQDGWEHVTAAYFKGEPSPYPAHYDGNRYHRAPRRLMTGLGQSVAGRIFLQQDQ